MRWRFVNAMPAHHRKGTMVGKGEGLMVSENNSNYQGLVKLISKK